MFKREKKIQTVGSISYFMNNEHNKKAEVKKDRARANKFTAATTLVPLATFAPSLAVKTFAAESVSNCGQAVAVNTAQAAVPVGASALIGKATVTTLTHALDPIFQLLTALAFPVCGLVIVGSLFYLAFGNAEKAWSGVQRGALSYILIQLSPVLLKVLEQIGNAL